MEPLQLQQIEEAEQRLRGIIHNTPVTRSQAFSRISGCEVYIKCENMQKTGSFKIRGAYNKLSICKESGQNGHVVAASAGNHAQGVAFAASKLGMPSTIVMPKNTPLAKVAATEGYGANVVLHGDYYDNAYQKALEIREQTQGLFIHGFDDPEIVAGQGTIGGELLRALPDADYVVLPAGGGGLLAGVAFYIKSVNPRVRVVGVQAEGANPLWRSFHEHADVNADTVSTIADGIAVGRPGAFTRELICDIVDDMVTVSDNEIASAMLLLLERSKLMVEAAGAASLAAVLTAKLGVKGKKVVCVLSGGNVDVSVISRVIETGLVSRGLKMSFKTVMPDIPGSLEKLARVLSCAAANIVAVQYDRLSADLRPNELVAHLVCEVRNREHGQNMVNALETAGYKVILE